MTIIIIASFSACDKRPKGVLSDKEMVQLIADIHTAEAYMQSYNSGYYNDSLRDSSVKWALDRHGLTRAEFDSTMSWYGRNIDEYKDLFEKVDKELAVRQKNVSGVSDQELNSSDLWPFSRHMLISENSPSNSLSFSFSSEDVQKGDKIVWKMRQSNNMSMNDVLLGVDYANGSSTYLHEVKSGDSKIEMTLQTDSAQTVKRIFGYLRVREQMSLPVRIDSIALQRLPVDTTDYYRINSLRKYSGLHKRTKSTADSINISSDDDPIVGAFDDEISEPETPGIPMKAPQNTISPNTKKKLELKQ